MTTEDPLAARAPDVRTVRSGDIPALASMLARAFEDDPVFEWIFPDSATRVTRTADVNRAMFSRLVEVDFVDMTTTEDLTGLAVWMGPDRWEPPARVMAATLPTVVRAARTRGSQRMLASAARLKRAHPRERHWYLMGLGTEPAYQRRGVGRAVLQPGLDRCDRDRLPAYLETQKEENLAYYHRFGFRVTGEVDLSRRGPHVWLMWREPSVGAS